MYFVLYLLSIICQVLDTYHNNKFCLCSYLVFFFLLVMQFGHDLTRFELFWLNTGHATRLVSTGYELFWQISNLW